MTDLPISTDNESFPAPNDAAAAIAVPLNSRDMNHPDEKDRGIDDTKTNQKSYFQEDRGRDSDGSNSSSRNNNQNHPAIIHTDEKLPDNIQRDPRGNGGILERMTQKATKRGNGRNTESFDPRSTLVRPDVRVLVGNPQHDKFRKPLKHDDVVVVPELFGPEDDWSLYYQLVKELTDLQSSQVKGSEFISWHEGSHLICKEPKQSPTFQKILKRLCDYFDIDASSAGTRFNWYKDSQDWKPFHHDSAAFNPRRAKSQNITVGVSFGATRELAFIRAAPEHLQNDPDFQYYQKQHPACRMYFPQTNNGVFTFGRDVNIRWKHGVNALPESEQSNKGRISIILWGLARNVVDEPNSPPLLGSDGQGPHANHNNNNHRDRHNHGHRGGGHGGRNNHHGHKRRRPDRDTYVDHHRREHPRCMEDDRRSYEDRDRRQEDRHRDDHRRHDDYDYNHNRRNDEYDRREPRHGKENAYHHHRN
ncbi:hypothetical protein IV203_020907 [Nitzschia inconspicua]|uniref:Uncharacterized protein n=1 Tax=Nitzschia inconspicua TaxID=303405 RepID=A0A9K3KFW0_9STRA|nr:hypothetical protein IV203_020907 [Nitzschia inconspicua]